MTEQDEIANESTVIMHTKMHVLVCSIGYSRCKNALNGMMTAGCGVGWRDGSRSHSVD